MGRYRTFQHEMQANQMDAHRLVWMWAAGVLYGVGVHGHLMDLPEENRILEFCGEYFLEQ